MKYLSFLLLFLLISCEETLVQSLPPFEEKLVVTSFIRPDSTISVFLTTNVSVLSTDGPKSITGAIISLYENDSYIGHLEETRFTDEYDEHVPDFTGVYVIDYRPLVGKTYRIEVEKEGYPSVRASTTIPVQTSNFEINLSDPRIIYNNRDGTSVHYRIDYDATINIQDAPQDNYYAVAVLDEIGGLGYEYDTNGDIVGCNVDKYAQEIDFSSSNVIFEGGQSSGFYEDGGKVFNDDLFQGQDYDFQISFGVIALKDDVCTPEMIFDRFFIQIRSLSEAYYQYIFTTTLQKSVLEDPFAEPVQIFSNVEGGLGVFAGYNIEIFEFSLHDVINEN